MHNMAVGIYFDYNHSYKFKWKKKKITRSKVSNQISQYGDSEHHRNF